VVSTEPRGTGLPHTRSPSLAWLLTAAGIAAVVGAAALIAPPEVSASPSDGAARAARPSSAPDPKAARYPLECAGAPVAVAKAAYGDADGDGRTDPVAAVHCEAGNGTPPHEVYVLSPGADPGSAPRVVARLLSSAQSMTVEGLTVRDGRITVRQLGYSSDNVPRCCPDLRAERTWRWTAGRFVLESAPLSANT
jgi:hypothetical protein